MNIANEYKGSQWVILNGTLVAVYGYYGGPCVREGGFPVSGLLFGNEISD